MKLVKLNDEIILFNNDIEIERYNFNKEINFRRYVDYLLSLNLETEIIIEDTINEKNEAEETLVRLILSIQNDYNNKVNEFSKFKATFRNK